MSVRIDRLREQIRQEVALLLERGEVKDPRIQGIVSVTDIELSRDLQHATLFVSVIGTAGVPELPERDDAPATGPGEPSGVAMATVLDGLNHSAGFLRGRLTKRLHIRHVPLLRFQEDTALAYGHRMDALLRSLNIPQEA